MDRLRETQRKLKRASQFKGALELIHAADIPFWILKGIEISFRNYGDPMVRPFGDLDILIPNKESIGKLRAFLLAKGWQDSYEDEWVDDLPRRNWYMDLRHHISMVDPVHSLTIELHWQLDHRFLSLSEQELAQILVQETDRVMLFNRAFNVLKPELEYVFLLAHGTRHAWCSFKWLVDLHHFPIDQLDPKKLEYWMFFSI